MWNGGKVQAMKGKTDDLIMALAIGTWMYDTSPSAIGKKSGDLSKSMAAAFGTNRNKLENSVLRQNVQNPYSPDPLFRARKYGWVI